MKFGLLTKHSAENDNVIDPETGLTKTGLDVYLKTIFPYINDWVYNEEIDLGKKLTPLYRSEDLNMVVLMDDVSHYRDTELMLQDDDDDEYYMDNDYDVVRIPYFLQLTREAAQSLFNEKINQKLFDEYYVSVDESNGPDTLCSEGKLKMAFTFLRDPYQFYLMMNSFFGQDLPIPRDEFSIYTMKRLLEHYKEEFCK